MLPRSQIELLGGEREEVEEGGKRRRDSKWEGCRRRRLTSLDREDTERSHHQHQQSLPNHLPSHRRRQLLSRPTLGSEVLEIQTHLRPLPPPPRTPRPHSTSLLVSQPPTPPPLHPPTLLVVFPPSTPNQHPPSFEDLTNPPRPSPPLEQRPQHPELVLNPSTSRTPLPPRLHRLQQDSGLLAYHQRRRRDQEEDISLRNKSRRPSPLPHLPLPLKLSQPIVGLPPSQEELRGSNLQQRRLPPRRRRRRYPQRRNPLLLPSTQSSPAEDRSKALRQRGSLRMRRSSRGGWRGRRRRWWWRRRRRGPDLVLVV